MDNEKPRIDYINAAFILGGIGVIASYGAATFFLLAPLYYAQRWIRSRPAAKEWGRHILTTTKDKIPALPAPKSANNDVSIKPLSLPFGRNTAVTRTSVKPENVRVVDPYQHLPFWERVTKPYDSNSYVNPAGAIVMDKNGRVKQGDAEERQYAYLNQALKQLPPYLHYTQLNEPPSRLSVPIGFDADTRTIIWGDFDADSDKARILHAMIAGQTGAGKDAILRLWFTTLTVNNTPEEIQFVILDGKIDWLSDALAQSAYMAIPPAGGIEIRKIDGKRVDQSKERMATSLDWIFDEVERRSELMRKAGAVNLNAYNTKARKNGDPTLPMLFLIASDVGEAFDGELEMLVKLLIMKGRAFGVRMIISMQNPIGESTKWRSQIGLVMSGYQQDPNHDRYIMGINKDRALVRPSQLPDPEDNDIGKGLFVVRQGSRQYLVRTPHLPEEDWFAFIESPRFFKHWYTADEKQDILNQLFELPPEPKLTRRFEPVAPVVEPKRYVTQQLDPNDPRAILTRDQIKDIASLAARGHTKSDIMKMMGFTDGPSWNAKKGAVEQVIIATRGSLKK